MIYTRHIYRELLWKLVWITGLLLLVFGSHRLVRFLGDAVEGGLPADLVFVMLGYKLVASMPKLMPAILMLTVLLSFVRMKHDRELMTLAGVGLGTRYQINVVLGFTSLYSVLVLLFVAWLSPLAEQRIHELRDEAYRAAALSVFGADQFKKFDDGRVVHVRKISDDKKSMEEIFLHTQGAAGSVVLRARSARIRHGEDPQKRYIMFNNGHRYVGEPGRRNYRITSFQDYVVPLDKEITSTGDMKPAALAFTELFSSDNPSHLAERHWRYAMVLACVLLAVFAVLITRSTSAEQRLLPVVIAILVYLSYSNLLAIGTRLLEDQTMPAALGLWWVHLILLAGLVFMLYLPVIEGWGRARRAASHEAVNTPP